MPTVTYTGRGHLLAAGVRQGLTRRLLLERGRPVEVSARDAKRLAELFPGRFAIDPDPGAATPAPSTPPPVADTEGPEGPADTDAQEG